MDIYSTRIPIKLIEVAISPANKQIIPIVSKILENTAANSNILGMKTLTLEIQPPQV